MFNNIITLAAFVAAVRAVEPYGQSGNGGGGGGGHHGQDYYTEPHYSFEYQVKDPHTHDIKSHKEERKGDHTQGVYELVEPDGSKRTVEYHVDGKSGFNVVVHRQQTKHPVSNSKDGHYSSVGYSGSSSGSYSRGSSGAHSGLPSGSYSSSGGSSGSYSGGSLEGSSGSYSGGSLETTSVHYSGGSSGAFGGAASGSYSAGSSVGYSNGNGGHTTSILGGGNSHGYKVHPESEYGDNRLDEEHRISVGSGEYSSSEAVLGAVGSHDVGHISGASQNVYDSESSSVYKHGSLIEDYIGSGGVESGGNSGYSSSASVGDYGHRGSSDDAVSYASYKSHGSPYSQSEGGYPSGGQNEEGIYSSRVGNGAYESSHVSEDASYYSSGGSTNQDQRNQVSYYSGETSSPMTSGYAVGSTNAGYGAPAYKGDGTATSSVKFSTHGAKIITKTNHIIPVNHYSRHY